MFIKIYSSSQGSNLVPVARSGWNFLPLLFGDRREENKLKNEIRTTQANNQAHFDRSRSRKSVEEVVKGSRYGKSLKEVVEGSRERKSLKEVLEGSRSRKSLKEVVTGSR